MEVVEIHKAEKNIQFLLQLNYQDIYQTIEDHHPHLNWRECDKTWHSSMALVIQKFQSLGLEYFQNQNIKSY